MDWETLLCRKRQRDYTSPKTRYDTRSEFQKDYHRIIGSASFRRLQDKTQVFPLDKSDFVRTRLTHSLEVSSFAKSLGQTVFNDIIASGADSSVTQETKEDACAVLECAGLIHDIGNPPFGHFGEDCIRSWFRRRLPELRFGGIPLTDRLTEQMKADLYSFEGNAQALRLITKLHYLVDETGMNLSYALLNTIIKYPVSSLGVDKTGGDIKTKKMGYYYSETELFGDITSSTGAYGSRYPLVYILEAADDIAYKTADIEDAVRKGFLSLDEIVYDLETIFLPKCRNEGSERELRGALEKLAHYREGALKRGVSSPEHNAVGRWSIFLQGVLLRCAASAFSENYREIMAGGFKKDLLGASDGDILADALSDIALRRVFRSREIFKLEISAFTILEFLLDKLVPAAIRFDSAERAEELDSRIIAQISENYLRAYRFHSEGKSEDEKLYLRLLLASDYVCGMTDSFAKRLYCDLNGKNMD